MSIRMLGVGAVAGALSTWLLLAPFVSTSAAESAPPFASTPGLSQTVAASCPDVSFEAISAEVRRVTREEFAAFDASFRNATPPPPPGESRAPDAVHVAAASRSRALLDSAISRRQWTDADADLLRGEMAGLPADQRAEIVRQLSVAINQGQVVPESDRLPF
jgi:hypothetical protein